jgi:hypothetical protein
MLFCTSKALIAQSSVASVGKSAGTPSVMEEPLETVQPLVIDKPNVTEVAAPSLFI